MARSVRTPVTAIMLAVAISLGGAATAQQAGQMPPPQVTVVTMQPQTITLSATLPGRVRASAEAEVRPQVNGIITERLFREGSMVAEGDVLYRIDPTTYEAAVAQAQASVSSAEAQLRAAEREFNRVNELRERGVATQQATDAAVSARDTALAQVDVANAALRTAQIQLEHSEVKARLSGRIGLSEVSPGSLVTAGQSVAMATIRKLDTVHVDVTQSAAELLQRRRGGSNGNLDDVEVSLTLADGSAYEQTGLLTAAEPHVDELTGVVVLRIEFPNPDMLLLPGMYVQVDMPTAMIENAYLVPQEAVTRDRRGNPQTMIVNAEGAVEVRALTVAQDSGANWVVTDGLTAGDRVIVAGLQRIAPGATVQPQERTETAAAAPAE
ncbi:hemolysin D [Oceanicola sp. 22II-s10i]|uniref:efflux RND transporter periplasmic adaptor subunit n=1 Tax=Oceanicola sp. 22II-s10i TaxID=1317116 RepID=UPI000B527DA1|nr:efflux RND transporter periplasmic adaptor subunit [Oceanicola sp. 22II-s10i]OWU85948.1 hemolysin D [Oceanicola sp. 22II-s10i]